MAHVMAVTDGDFQNEVLDHKGLAVVDFWATWCGPCRMVAPILDQLATEYAGKARIAKVNIDDHQDLAAQFGIRAIPTLLLFKGGQVVEQVVGLKSKRDLKSCLDRSLV